MRIKTKILLPTIALTLLVTAAILLSNTALFSGFADEATVEEVNVATKVAVDSLESLKARAAAASMSIAGDAGIQSALLNNDREGLLARARSLQNETGAEFCTITDAAGTVIARTHEPESFGDSLAAQANVQAALHGEALAAVEEGTIVRLSARAGTPVFDGQGAVVGVVSAGFRLDTGSFVDRLKEILGCEITVVLNDERIATTILDEDGTRAIGTRADAQIKETVFAGNTYSGRIDILGRPTICNYVPIYGASGQPIGMLFIGQYFDQELQMIREFVQGGLILAFIMLAASIVIILVITGRIVTPIQAMTKAATALAAGDTDLDIQVNTNDEMRTLADAFNSMIENTRRQVQIVESIAKGDLEVSIPERSEKDIMNRALEKLNATIRMHAAAIRKEHELTKLMLDATPLASRLWDSDYNLIECNEASVKLFGVKSKREYIERHFEFAPEYQPCGVSTREKTRALVREAFEKGICRDELMYRMPDGSPLPAEVTLVRVPYGDDYVVAAYSRDLREQVQMMSEIKEASAQLEEALEEARRANSAKSDFLARMSHEMRTPLNAIIGLSEISLGGSLDEETQLNLEKIYNSGSTLLSIVNDILDISKIQSGNFAILPDKYDIPSLVNDSILQNVLRIGSRPIRFNLNIDENMPARLLGDELRIKQIINNLLSNAFKYTEEGTVELGLSGERDGETVWLTIRVSDTGIGIQKEHLGKLFADYTQFGATSYHQADGTGLGLAITKKLTEMMDGEISVESEFGKGSVFTVRLRQGYVDGAVIGAAVAESLKRFDYSANKLNRNARANRIPLPYARVLLVDDNITNLDVTKGLMKPYQMQVDCVTSGEAAVRAIRDENVKYSAIFMDHMMPGMDGVEATRAIRELGTEYAKTVPIIALTANAVAGSEEMFLSNGFQAFISKPIDITRLDAILRQWVRDKSRENALPKSGEPAKMNGAFPVLGDISIGGLDIAKALERFDGDKAALTDVLSSYAKGTRELLSELMELLKAGKLDEYAIAVHGIKGSSYAIHADAVGHLAKALEKAAAAEDLDEVKRIHPAFEKAASALLDKLDRALGETGRPPAAEDIADTDEAPGFTAPNAEVLIVEDNETNRKAALGLLKPLKMRIDTAENGLEALRKIKANSYHLIFMDYRMPVMDGVEATYMLRGMEKDYFKHVPVIALTANEAEDAAKWLFQAGVNDIMVKPFKLKALLAALRKHLPARLISENAPRSAPKRAAASPAALPAIRGIDSREGLRYSGTKELFASLLGDFYKLIDIKAAKIESCLAQGRLRDMAIEAHALKNTASMLGAKELSEGFRLLERYGNEENREALEREAPVVLQQYRGFKPLLKPFGETGKRKHRVSGAVLIRHLREMKAAVDGFDLDGADRALKRLAKFRLPEQAMPRMESLKAYMADVAMEEILETADDMIAIIENLPKGTI